MLKRTLILVALMSAAVTAAPILHPNGTGVNGKTWSGAYDEMMNALLNEDRVITSVGDKLWVPWYDRSDQCTVDHLQDDNACDASTIDGTHNCMVTDEFSQVGLLIAMHDDQERMEQFFNTVKEIDSDNGDLPAWRLYRDGSVIKECKDGINGNCDTASDATARIIMALFTAGNNDAFSEDNREAYKEYAANLAYDMVKYEVEETCRPTDYGETCHWLAAGSEAKRGGLRSTDFGYTGYYADAIIAMIQAHANTGDEMFLAVADDFTRNYLQAAQFDGDFSVPPGRSFRWTNLDGKPQAECTNGCDPVMWDGADAPRATGMCLAEYYADKMGHNLPELDTYCQKWGDEHMSDPDQAPIQYKPDGTADEPRSGYFSQGLQSLFLTGYDTTLFDDAVKNAVEHYSPETQTWDYTACFGVYHQAFPMRALGIGMGETLNAVRPDGEIDYEGFNDSTQSSGTASSQPYSSPDTQSDSAPAPSNPDSSDDTGSSTTTSGSVSELPTTCSLASCEKRVDTTEGACRTVEYASDLGDIDLLACDKGGVVEVYRQSAPDISFEACIGDACVDEMRGFAETPLSSGNLPDESQTGQSETTPEDSTPTNTEDGTDAPNNQPDDGGTTSSYPLRALSVTCDAGTSCSVKTDSTEGACRSVTLETEAGDIDLLACDKGGVVEVYRQSAPNTSFEACIGDACVNGMRGFATTPLPETTNNSKPEAGDQLESSDTGEQSTRSDSTDPTNTEVGSDSNRIANISLACKIDGSCSVATDTVNGKCRSVEFATDHGPIVLLGCEKQDGVEVYRQSAPDTSFKACMGTACVDELRGYAELGNHFGTDVSELTSFNLLGEN